MRALQTSKVCHNFSFDCDGVEQKDERSIPCTLWRLEIILTMKTGSVLNTTLTSWNVQYWGSRKRVPNLITLQTDMIVNKKSHFRQKVMWNLHEWFICRACDDTENKVRSNKHFLHIRRMCKRCCSRKKITGHLGKMKFTTCLLHIQCWINSSLTSESLNCQT